MAKRMNDNDFDLGLDNAQLEDGIQEANAYEVGKSLNETLKETNKRLENLVWTLAVTENTMDELRTEAQLASPEWERLTKKWKDDLQLMLSVVLTPEATEHFHKVYQAFAKTFDEILKARAEESEKRMAAHANRIVNSADRMMLAPALFYVIFALLLILSAFFGITWWANANVFHSPQLQSTCYVFAALLVGVPAIIVGVFFWLRNK